MNDTIITSAIIYNGDTIEAKTLERVEMVYVMTPFQRKNYKAYNRVRNAVLVTYPYARKAGGIMNKINRELVGISGEEQRRKIIRQREKELKKEFTEPLTNLSVYQGRVLMKLINRETGNDCYEIIKEYKGGLTARAYQTVAFFFKSSLKQTYDAKGEDATIEFFVKEAQRIYGLSETSSNPTLASNIWSR